MRQRFAKFMYGRYGLDEFSRFLNFAALVPVFFSLFLTGAGKAVCFLLTLAPLVYSYFRMFSRSFAQRRAENAAYLRQKQKLSGHFSLRREMWQQRREFRFFKCPSCRAVMRVPKGKGKIRIVCKKCGTAFAKKS